MYNNIMDTFSQQDILYKNPNLKRSITYPPEKKTSIPIGFISEDEADARIEKFEANKQKYIKEILQKIQILKDRQAKYYYFIGRLNPPHEGHVAALLNVITNALEDGGKAIILLGSGPNGGMRTSKDPLGFDLKKEFIIAKLKEELLKINPQLNIESLFAPNGQVEILEMGRPVSQIQGVIKDDMQNLLDTLNEIYTFRISGEKDGDLEKLAWIEKGLEKARIINDHGEIIPITTDVIPQPAVIIESEGSDEIPEALSATRIRNIVYNMDPTLPDKIENFRLQTRNFYGDFTPLIFNAIDEYNPTKFGKATNEKKSKKSKGGSRKSKRRKHKLTKRRKSKRVKKHRKSKRRLH